MDTNTKGLHHLHVRKRVYQNLEPYPHPDRLKRFFDKLIYVAAVLCPILTLPQLFKVWMDGSAAGVSLISWAGFAVISIMWLGYGILHKEKPIIFMYLALSVLQALIVAGVIINT